MTYRRALNGVGTFANRPTAPADGYEYMCTDSPLKFVRTNGLWKPYYGSIPLMSVPTASNFTLIQTGSVASLTDDGGGLLLASPQRVATEDSILAAQANPGGTGAAYTLTVGFIPNTGERNGTAGLFNYHVTGIGIYNTSTTQYRSLISYGDAAGAFLFQLRGATGLTATPATTFNLGGYQGLASPMIWFRVSDDGTTNRTWSFSTDGKHFKRLNIEARTTGFSSQPDRIGPYISPLNADASMYIISYELTSP